jgi:hypothetical protein
MVKFENISDLKKQPTMARKLQTAFPVPVQKQMAQFKRRHKVNFPKPDKQIGFKKER